MAKLERTFSNVTKDLQEAQKADHDGREKAREADHFINKRDGQWEPRIISMYKGKPRYTIDLTSGIVNDAHGEMSSMEFDIKVRPAGGPATTEIALHYDGLLRNIENNSGNGAKFIYRAAGKQMLTTGIGGWGVKQGFRDPMSFDQDLMIYPISNFMDRVWFSPGAELQDMSDANEGWKLTSMSTKVYERDFPNGSQMSVGRDVYSNVYSYKNDNAVVVGEYFWKKPETVTLVRMTDGSVYVDDDDFKKVKDELAAQGITVEKERKTESFKVYHQLFDGVDFLTESKRTVFTYIPLVPVFGNFEISEDKVIYWGLVEKHMDPQRILNYVESRKVEEGALAPRKKIWMTKKQGAAHKKQLRTLNTNTDPVQFYDHITGVVAPYETGGASINPGLSEASQSMQKFMQSISGRLDPSGTPDIGLQSGVALEALVNKGDTGNISYFTSMEIAIAHTCRICIGATPEVYDAQREIQLDSIDGASKTITINQRVFDEESKEIIEINDLSKGIYSVICDAGPSFYNRQQETIQAMNNIAKIDPSILQIGSDVYLNNIPAPGMDKIAERRRMQMVDQGLIPENQLTDKEKERVQVNQQNQQNQPPSAVDQALIATANAEQETAQGKTADIMSKIEERDNKLMLAINKLSLESKKVDNEQKNNENKLILESMQAQDDQIKTMAETLETIRKAMGVDTIVGESNTQAYKKQSDDLRSAIITKE